VNVKKRSPWNYFIKTAQKKMGDIHDAKYAMLNTKVLHPEKRPSNSTPVLNAVKMFVLSTDCLKNVKIQPQSIVWQPNMV